MQLFFTVLILSLYATVKFAVLKHNPYLFACIRHLFAFIVSWPLIAGAQPVTKYPQGYFRWPLNLTPEIVANMGELRTNHWHMGLDMRTNQKTDQPVYAAAEGYIAYAGVRPMSYGRFIIINHPNGLSTLYGHLNDFAPALEAYVTEQQYKQESWAVELTIPREKFPVSKGSFIAYSGTTGGSQGPHVHFEIRDTKTEKCLNPLLFGMPLADDVPPTIVRLAVYDGAASSYEQSPRLFTVKKTDNGYIIPKLPVLKTTFPFISFGLQAYDRINGSGNQDGIYSAKLFVDDRLQGGFTIDSIDYRDTRYMNAQIDYTYRANGGAFIQLLSRLPGNNAGVYHPGWGDGVIRLPDTALHTVRIETADAYGNSSVLSFGLQFTGDAVARQSSVLPSLFLPGYVNVLEKPDFEAFLPEACLYDSVRPLYYRNNSNTAYAVSALHRLNDGTIPLHTGMTVRIKPDKIIPDEWKNKLVIKRTDGNSSSIKPAKWQGSASAGAQWLSASFDGFGSFQAFADITPPSVNKLGRGDTIDLSAANRIIFTPTDNSGIKSFRAELDQQWLRFTNDKGRSWIYGFDERCPYGVHSLKVTVSDIAGNVTENTWWFKRYPYTPPPKKALKKKTTTWKTAVKKGSAKKK